jgi:hypothetical protein
MMNSLETYRDIGRKTALAVKHRDAANARFHTDWFHRAVQLEDPCGDRGAARHAYEDGYAEVSGFRRWGGLNQ